MREERYSPQDDPFDGSVAAYWSFGYDMPDELGGGFVTGELLLRGDGILLRRYSDGKRVPGHRPWEEVTWWTPGPDPERAARVLNYRGYDLHKLDTPKTGAGVDAVDPEPDPPWPGSHPPSRAAVFAMQRADCLAGGSVNLLAAGCSIGLWCAIVFRYPVRVCRQTGVLPIGRVKCGLTVG